MADGTTLTSSRPTAARRRRRRRRLVRAGIVAGIASVVGSLMLVVGFLVLDALYPFPLERLEQWPECPQVCDRTGTLLLITVGDDDQWRRPVPLEEMGEWLPLATVAVEDERFFEHRGVDPWAVLRAMGQNASAGRVVSGASTITMQLCKMLYGHPRTFTAKLHEAFRALQLERSLDKAAILEHYLDVAPYGGNLRGVEAAARHYFGRSARDLTLGEASLLAGLPQSPSRYRPDRYLDRALARRRVVLEAMREQGCIDRAQLERALEEPVRLRSDVKPPRLLEHGAWWARSLRPGGGDTTFDVRLQRSVEEVVVREGARLPAGTDVAVVVIHVPSAELRAMIGSLDPDDPRDGQVNGAVMRRSPGSTLKPFIFGTAFERRRLSPQSPIDDRPIVRAGWAPANFGGEFHGRVTAADALRRSLNVPAILVAEAIGLEACVDRLRRAGVDLPADVVSRSGLALVTGATEVRLLDLTNAYATLARRGRHRRVATWMDESARSDSSSEAAEVFSPATCAMLDDILGSHARIPHGYEHYPVGAAPWFAWKTGTSSGRRDAWAIGHNSEWAIGVWVGAFAGGGDVHYVGAEAAEPILAQLFALPAIAHFDRPPAPPPLDITRPLVLTQPECSPLRILEPEDGAMFIAVG
ncbi:MAG: penicillin-binding protein 1C, partial [Planctomycetes bacterium]|nr:penicillin-binding protein 1C [Planctomycetota bacterium]